MHRPLHQRALAALLATGLAAGTLCAAPPLTGSGTEADPYQIGSKADVMALAKYVNGTDDGSTATNSQAKAGGDPCAGLYFALTADIDMGADTTFLGIGSVASYHRTPSTAWKFSGNLDGRGHTIRNLRINGMQFKADGSVNTTSNTTTMGSRRYIGFIGILDGGTVSNLNFDASCSVTANGYVGMVVGRMAKGSKVSNCSVAGTVRSYYDGAGGIVGDTYATSSVSSTIENCLNAATVYCNTKHAGGITGGSYYGIVTNCVNTGSVQLHSFHSSKAEGEQENGGGIVGYWQTGGVITNCLNAGTVSVSKQYAGGIAGRNTTATKVQIASCLALGYVDCPSAGLKGMISGNLYNANVKPTDCYYDASLWGDMAAGCKGAEGITGLTTQVLTSGTLPSGLGSAFWQAQNGLYPRLTLQAEKTLAAAQTYLLFPSGTSATDFGTEATISTLGSISAAIANEEGSTAFSISGGKVLVADVHKVVHGTVTLRNGDYTLVVPLTKIPVLFSGSGTEADPYIIASRTDLENMASMCNGSMQEHYTGKFFRQTADIDMANQDFDGIACVQTGTNYPERTYWFAGTYDGGGHLIRNLKIDRVRFADNGDALSYTVGNGSAENVGLFGSLGVGARIKNVRIQGGMVRGYNAVGAIAGLCLEDVQITDCHNGADVTCYGGTVGGILGQAKPSGKTTDIYLERCVNTGAILSNSDEAGGIIGYSIAQLKDCINTGSVTARHFNDGISKSFSEVQNAGGIAGTNQGNMTYCANFGAVYCDGNECGGLTGFTSGGHSMSDVIGCYNAGQVWAKDMTLCGALIGDNYILTSSNGTKRDCAFDSQYSGCGAANNSDASFAVPLTTAEFTSGEAWLGNSGWTYRKGFYPINTALASEPAVLAACASYITMPEGQVARDFRSGTLSTAQTITAVSSDADAIAVSGTAVSANTAATDIASAVVTLRSGDYSRPLTLQFLPAVLPGAGTQENPYLVASAADFARIGTYMTRGRYAFRDRFFAQTADIDFAGQTYQPVGTDGNWFGGHYDGRNHSVSGVTLTAEATTETCSVGLFGGIAQGGSVANLTLKNFNIQANQNGGLLAGTVNGTVNGVTTDASCTLTGIKSTVLYTGAKGEQMGGIAGLMGGAARIEKCVNHAAVNGLKYVGGIVGFTNISGNAVVADCANHGTITGTAPLETKPPTGGGTQPTTSPTDLYTGGIAGQIRGTVSRCLNYGTVTMEKANDMVGGIAGRTFSATTVEDCANYGLVYSRNYTAGGIVGETGVCTPASPNVIANCHNYGEVKCINELGGIVGMLNAYNTVRNCGNHRPLHAFGMRAGGIAGEVAPGVYGYDPFTQIVNCYNTDSISANGYTAGIAGYISAAGASIQGCFNVGAVSASTANGGAAGIANAYAGASTFAGCYNLGTIAGKRYVGGILGNATLATLSNSYNYGDILFSGTDANRANAVGNVAGMPGATVTNCYYSGTAFDVDGGYGENVKNLSVAELMKAPLGQTFVLNANCLPMIAGLDTVAAAKATAAYFVLRDGDSFTSLSHSFQLGQLPGVLWSVSGNLRLDGDRCRPGGKGLGTLTATCGDFSRTYTFDSTTGVTTLDTDADPVVSTRHYLPDGTLVLDPKPGTTVVTVTVTASGRRSATRRVVR